MNKKYFLTLVSVFSIVSLYLVNKSLYTMPENFKTNSSFEVLAGDSVYTISEKLEKSGYINSASLFRVISIYKNRNLKIVEGVYDFKEKLNMLQVVNKFAIAKGESSFNSTRRFYKFGNRK
jgi:cell division protein YceG involved in septum cleavage